MESRRANAAHTAQIVSSPVLRHADGNELSLSEEQSSGRRTEIAGERLATFPAQVQYPVMEHFYTLQGEGAHSGRAAYFIRLGGCDVGCVWCDVKESWDADAHPRITVEALLSTASAHPGRLVVITGGEPAMHNLAPICDALHGAGFRVHIETSGSHLLRGDLDWVTLSPKKFKAPLEANLPLADELKVVVFNKTDFAWGEKWAALVRPDCRLYLQPEWDKRDTVTPMILDYVQQHPQWTLSLQTHKYLNIP